MKPQTQAVSDGKSESERGHSILEKDGASCLLLDGATPSLIPRVLGPWQGLSECSPWPGGGARWAAPSLGMTISRLKPF